MHSPHAHSQNSHAYPPTTPFPWQHMVNNDNNARPTLSQDATSAYTANLLMASVAGLPAVVVPCGLTKPRSGAPAGTPDAERLPVALEFMGLPEKDDKLLAIAAAFQRLAPMLADPIVVAAFKTGVGRDMTS